MNNKDEITPAEAAFLIVRSRLSNIIFDVATVMTWAVSMFVICKLFGAVWLAVGFIGAVAIVAAVTFEKFYSAFLCGDIDIELFCEDDEEEGGDDK